MLWSLQLLLCVVLWSPKIIFSFMFPLQFLAKMRTNQSYPFILLLVSFSASCTSDCSTRVTRPSYLPAQPQPAYDECAKLHSILERGLFENPGTLYQLYDILFPLHGFEPTYILVKYKLNDSVYNDCWTSSGLLRSVDPSVLSSLQLDPSVLASLQLDPSVLCPSNWILLFWLPSNSG